MPVRITKPEIDLREIINELDKPTGIAGQAILAAETPQEQQALIGAGPNRNLIINGGFQIWQRGTSGTSGYVADRWKGPNCSAQSKQYDAEVGNYLQLTATNAAIMYYGIELDETGQSAPFEVGETYTISLKVKSTAVMYKPNVSFRDNLASGTNTVFTSKEIKAHKGTGEWEDVVYQFVVDAAPHGTAPLFELTLVSFDFANTPINIAQVQMVKGTVATPFQYRSRGEELALCQRYYYQINEGGADRHVVAMGFALDSDDCYGIFHLPVAMRGSLNITMDRLVVYYTAGSTFQLTGNTIQGWYNSPAPDITTVQVMIDLSTAVLTAHQVVGIGFPGNANPTSPGTGGYISFYSDF